MDYYRLVSSTVPLVFRPSLILRSPIFLVPAGMVVLFVGHLLWGH